MEYAAVDGVTPAEPLVIRTFLKRQRQRCARLFDRLQHLVQEFLLQLQKFVIVGSGQIPNYFDGAITFYLGRQTEIDVCLSGRVIH